MQQLTINSTLIELGILQWHKSLGDEFPVHWCDSYLRITNKYIHYENSGEFLSQREWRLIVQYTESALAGQIQAGTSLRFIEPDISFHYFCNEHYILELIIHFADENGCNGETWTIPLNQKETEEFLVCIKNEIQLANNASL